MSNRIINTNDTAMITHPVIRQKHLRASVLNSIYIEPGTMKDYQRLSHYHYRQAKLGPIAGIWVVRCRLHSHYIEEAPVAVIVYTYPAPNLAVRNIAVRKYFCLKDNSKGLAQLNRHVRCISRVIVEPRWRGLGLGAWLVRTTMPMLDVAMIESMASMGRFHPFLLRAGMRPFSPPADPAAEKLIAALESLRITRDIWHDPDQVQVRMDCLCEMEADRLDRRMKAFLGRFGKRRKMLWSIERTTFVLERLAQSWTYFAWLNPKIRVKGLKLQKSISIPSIQEIVVLSANVCHSESAAADEKSQALHSRKAHDSSSRFIGTEGDIPHLMPDTHRQSNTCPEQSRRLENQQSTEAADVA